MAFPFSYVSDTTCSKFFLPENIYKATSSQMRNTLVKNRNVRYSGLTRYAHAIGDTHKAFQREPNLVDEAANDKPKWGV